RPYAARRMPQRAAPFRRQIARELDADAAATAVHDRAHTAGTEPLAVLLEDGDGPTESDTFGQKQTHSAVAHVHYFGPASEGRTHPHAATMRLVSIGSPAFQHSFLLSPHSEMLLRQLLVDHLLECFERLRALDLAAVDEERRRAHAVFRDRFGLRHV